MISQTVEKRNSLPSSNGFQQRMTSKAAENRSGQ
jgi:hypothetical protein